MRWAGEALGGRRGSVEEAVVRLERCGGQNAVGHYGGVRRPPGGLAQAMLDTAGDCEDKHNERVE